MFYNNGYNQDWSTLKKLVWLRGNPATGQIGTDLTVSGTPPLSLPNSLGKPLKAWSVDLLPYQEGSGDPSPDNVRPIHGTDKLTITTAGVNLFNPANVLNGYLKPTGAFTASTSGEKTFFAYLPAGQYTYSKPLLTTRARYCLFDTLPINGAQGSIVSIGNWDNYHCSTTLTKPCYFVAWNYNNAGETYSLDEVLASTSINIGMTALPYEPYVGTTSVLTLPQTVYTGTIGSEGGESISGEYDLHNVSWVMDTNRVGVFYGSIPNRKPSSYVLNCDSYKVNNVGVNTTNDNYISGIPSYGSTLIFLRDTRFSTSAEARAGITGKVYFELANPVQFAITAPDIPTPRGGATTWATAEDGTVDGMEVTYVGKA